MKLLRLPAVLDALAQGPTAAYDDIKQGLLTPPLKRDRSSFWPEHEIQAVVAARISAKSDAEIRALVANLVAARESVFPEFVRSSALPLAVSA